jgi:Holliday junction DNA helicase RuvA
MALFSVLSLGDLRSAILRDDVKALLAAPGVGRKLAARLVLELKDKAMAWAADEAAPGETGPTRSDDDRAVAMLSDLGYRPAQAARAVESARRALGEAAPFEEIVRRALTEAVTA